MNKTDTRLSPREAEAVLQTWRLKPIFTRPGGGTANASLVIVGSRGTFILRRRNPRYASPDQLTYDHAVLHGLAKAGLPVPRVIRTPHGSRWVEHDGRIYELFEFIEGVADDPESLEEVEAAGHMLARFHLATERMEVKGKKQWPRYFDPRVSLKGLHEAGKRLVHGDTGKLGGISLEDAADTIDYLIAQAQRTERELPDRAYRALPHTIIHGDWHPANLRFRNHEVVGIFDFDWVGWQPRMIDVTDGLLFFGGRRRGKLDGGDIWSLTQGFDLIWERLERFMVAYRHHINITRDELQALPALMRQRCLYNRVDAMVRKIEPEDQIRFLVTDVRGPFEWIEANQERLQKGKWGTS